jgi:hypothetical protein
MRQVLICLLIFVAVFNSGSVRTREAQANPAIVLVPEAAVGMLFLLAAGCTAAYEMGTITRAQNDDYQRDLHEKIDAIQNAVRRALDTTGEAVMKAVATMIYIQSVIHSPYICEQKLLKVADSFSSSQKTTEARKSAVGECRPDLRGNPYNCCPNFMSKFGKGNDMSKIGENSFRVSYFGRHSIKRECCFEWDSLHGRFEVYKKGNHEPIKHMGEKSCGRDEDLSEDLCNANYPDKSDFLSSRHAPRHGCP